MGTVLLLWGAWIPLWADLPVQTITYEKGPTDYEIALLDLALSKTVADYGRFVLKNSGLDLTERRAVASLQQGLFDVTFMVLTPEREEELLPIRIDLTHGVQGYRLFLIHKDSQAAFAAVRSLEDLRRRFVAGFGAQWGDLGVLQFNHLPVSTANETSQLYDMLQARRFDYFPRGINEIWDNVEQHRAAAPDMVVEQHLALFYPLVQCFVVAKDNVALAARIETGLQRSLADGSMKRLFLQFHGPDIARARLGQRVVFELSNPALPLGGPSVDPSWWLPRK
jgi:hypothetical protein